MQEYRCPYLNSYLTVCGKPSSRLCVEYIVLSLIAWMFKHSMRMDIQTQIVIAMNDQCRFTSVWNVGVMSHEREGASFHRPLLNFFVTASRLTKTKQSMLCITGPFVLGKHSPHKRVITTESVFVICHPYKTPWNVNMLHLILLYMVIRTSVAYSSDIGP